MTTPPTAADILRELQPLGKESYKRVMMNNHAIPEPIFGVPISKLKKIQRRIRKDYQLALDLYDTGNYDAMYLAGLIADDARMTRKDLQHWADKARHGYLWGTAVASVAARSPHGREMALKWIDSPKAHLAAAGWATWACFISITDDAELDLAELKGLLQRVQRTVRQAPGIVQYQMNNFVIGVGCHVAPLSDCALQTGALIGTLDIDMGNNDCKVPFAPDYIRKVQSRGTLGRKQKRAK